MKKSVETREGVFYIDGKPQVLVTADYPYYRDDRNDWSGQLDNIKKMGVDTVTCYIPWRHHSTRRGEFDFTGIRRPNTDVLYFLKLIHEKNMKVIVKPGPLIHAETNFGGLPDYVSAIPDHGIEPLTTSRGEALKWSNPLPAYLGERYLERLSEWFDAVSARVIKGKTHPKGPIVGLQILNEGFYTNAAAKVTDYDYSPSGINFFREFLKRKYKTIAKLNGIYKTNLKLFEDVYAPREFRAGALDHLHLYLDWAEYSSFLFSGVIRKYLELLGGAIKDLPVFINLNLCGDKQDAEIYAVRNNPHALKDLVCWGYTDWAGPIAENEEPARKYRIVASLSRGVCMEENWGFSKIYNPLYRFVQPSFYQTMYYMALGSAGFNVYTAVSTDSWDDHLDLWHKPPYPEHSPVSENGAFRDQFHTLHQMSAFMKREGADLVSSKRDAEVAWAIYSPYCRAASWLQPKSKWLELGLSDEPKSVYDGLDTFQRMMAYNTIENDAVYIQEVPAAELKKYKMLCIAGCDWMDSNTLSKLTEFVKAGGTLLWSGAIPRMNELWQDNAKDAAGLFPVKTKVIRDEGTCLISFGNDEFTPLEKVVDSNRRFETIPSNGDVKLPSASAKPSFSLTGFTAISEHPVFCFENGKGAEPVAVVEIDGRKHNCAYINKLGKGQVIYAGFNPWDLDKWERNADFLLFAMERYGNVRAGMHGTKQNRGEIEVYEHRNDKAGKQYVYVFSRNRNNKAYNVSFRNSEGGEEVFEIMLTGYSSAVVGFKDGNISSALIKGINDEKGIFTAPLVRYRNQTIKTDAPGDLFFHEKGSRTVFNFIGPRRPANITLPAGDKVVEVVELKDSKEQKGLNFKRINNHIVFSA
ncbi:MAG: beta-galactosidase [Elusimicrobiota bacterium]